MPKLPQRYRKTTAFNLNAAVTLMIMIFKMSPTPCWAFLALSTKHSRKIAVHNTNSDSFITPI